MASFVKSIAVLISVTSPSKALQFGGSVQVEQPVKFPTRSSAEGQVPAEPGCYIRKLKGCPRHPEFSDSLWKHASQAERYKRARVNRTACEVDVKEAAMEWCGVAAEAIQVLFVTEPQREERTSSPWRVARASGPFEDDHPAPRVDEPAPAARQSGSSSRGGKSGDNGWAPQQKASGNVGAGPAQVMHEGGDGGFSDSRQPPLWEEQEEAAQRAREGGSSSSGSKSLELGWAPQQKDSRQPPSWEEQEEAAQRAREGGSSSGSKSLERGWAAQQKEQEEAAQRAREGGGESSSGSKSLDGGWAPQQTDSRQPPSWEEQEEAAQRAREVGSSSSKSLEQGWAPQQKDNRQPTSWEEQEEAAQRAREGGGESSSGSKSPERGWAPQQQDSRQPPSWEEQEEAAQRAREVGSSGSKSLEQGWAPQHKATSWTEEEEEAANRARQRGSQSSSGSERGWAPQQEDSSNPLWDESPVQGAPQTGGGHSSGPSEDFPGASGSITGPVQGDGTMQKDFPAAAGSISGPAQGDGMMREESTEPVSGMPGGWQEGPLPAMPQGSSNESVYNPMEVAEGAGHPKEPGCFVRTPSGCPNHPNFSGSDWQHDTYAERSTTAMLNSTECEVVRKSRIEHWCGTEDVQMKHVAPLLPGCYVRTPDGCPNHPAFNTSSWKHEEYGENFTEASATRVACESTRRAQVVSWCGSDTVEMLFIPAPSKEDRGLLISASGHWNKQEASMDPGCFVRTPSGCPQHPSFGGALWRHDDFAERTTTANKNRTVCEVTRKESVMHWCSTEDVEMMFVPKPPPGCYVRTPTGCPNHPTWGSPEWRHEEYGENNTNSMVSRSICEVNRKASVMRWCGTKDVHMAFVPPDWGSLLILESDSNSEDTGIPKEPGCFVRTPSGCPRHPSFNTTRWRHEEFGEKNTKGTRREHCETERKKRITAWCGVEDIEMLFVPPIEPGCYIRTPSGCPNYPEFSSDLWKHEEHGEQYTDATANRVVCEVDRKATMEEWCGSKGIEMMFIPALRR